MYYLLLLSQVTREQHTTLTQTDVVQTQTLPGYDLLSNTAARTHLTAALDDEVEAVCMMTRR